MNRLSLKLNGDDICTVDMSQQALPGQQQKAYWLSWWTAEAYRGRGLATTNVRIMLGNVEWADDLVIYAMINESNPASRRVAEKAGFVLAPEELQTFRPKSYIYIYQGGDSVAR